MTDLPTLKLRPTLDRWLRDRGMGPTDLAKRWSISPQGASRYLLPFDDPRRVIPNEDRIEDIVVWTRGEVTVSGWYHPTLSGAPIHASIGDVNHIRAAEDVQ